MHFYIFVAIIKFSIQLHKALLCNDNITRKNLEKSKSFTSVNTVWNYINWNTHILNTSGPPGGTGWPCCVNWLIIYLLG